MQNQGGCCNPQNSCDTKKECGTDKGSCGTGGGKSNGCCWSTVFKGALIAGIVIFVVNAIAWTVLPFHKENMKTFANEKEVAAVIAKNAETSGLYVLPFVADPSKDKPAVDKPYVYATVKADGVDFSNMTPQLIREGILCLVLGGLLTCLLKKITCGCPIMASVKIGFLVGLAATMPGVIWFAFPLNEALVSLADIVIAFALAGFVLSKTILKSCASGGCCGKPGCGCMSKGSCSK
jgi:hypothetical protein